MALIGPCGANYNESDAIKFRFTIPGFIQFIYIVLG